MITWLENYILKKIYKKLIIKTELIDKNNILNGINFKDFCKLDVNTTAGVFTFVFKKDRRNKNRESNKYVKINNYIIELITPNELVPKEINVGDKILFVVKLAIIDPNKRVLCNLLLDLYLDKVIETINRNK